MFNFKDSVRLFEIAAGFFEELTAEEIQSLIDKRAKIKLSTPEDENMRK